MLVGQLGIVKLKIPKVGGKNLNVYRNIIQLPLNSRYWKKSKNPKDFFQGESSIRSREILSNYR